MRVSPKPGSLLRGLNRDWKVPDRTGAPTFDAAISCVRPVANAGDPLEDPAAPAAAAALPHIFSQAGKATARVLICGDYDVDGVCSSAILSLLIEALGGKVAVSLPNRFVDHYGIVYADVEQAAAERGGFDLLVSADCGSADARKLADTLEKLGRPGVIIDHHLGGHGDPRLHEFNPASISGANPSEYSAGTLCGLLAAQLHASGAIDSVIYHQACCLAGLAAIADVAAMTGPASRFFARQLLATGSSCGLAGLEALCRTMGIHGAMTTQDVGFRLAPPINAAGRLESASVAFELLRCSQPALAGRLCDKLIALNERRKSLQEGILSEAFRLMGPSDNSLVAFSELWHPGIVGNAAGRLAETRGLPVFLGSVSKEKGSITFSGRSGGRVHLLNLASECFEGLNARFGGHAAAMGFSVADNPEGRETIREFAKRLEARLGPLCSRPTAHIDLVIRACDVSVDAARTVALLEPFGPGHTEPVFLVPDVHARLSKLSGIAHSARGKATDTKGNSFDFVSFRNNSLCSRSEIRGHAIGTLSVNEFRGVRRAQLQILDFVQDEAA